MEPKYLAEEVITHPNHHLTFGDWIHRAIGFLRDDVTSHLWEVRLHSEISTLANFFSCKFFVIEEIYSLG